MVQLRNRVNSRQSSSSDARNVLDRAAFLNNYIADRQLSYQTENNWSTLRQDLDRLASAFNIAWNWSNVPERRLPVAITVASARFDRHFPSQREPW